METHNAEIIRSDTNAILRLALKDQLLDIVLTEDKPNDVKNVFNKLLEQLKNGQYQFSLTDNKEDLYFHICKEYLTQLNAELLSIYKELEDNCLIKNK